MPEIVGRTPERRDANPLAASLVMGNLGG